MHVLTGAVIEAKLKITREKMIFADVMTRRKNSVAAVIRKFESNDAAFPVPTVLPSRRVPIGG